jgi:hypothetical protein
MSGAHHHMLAPPGRRQTHSTRQQPNSGSTHTHAHTCLLTSCPSGVMMTISPGCTSRTRSNAMGPNAQSSLATAHSMPEASAEGRLPMVSGRMPCGSRNATRPTCACVCCGAVWGACVCGGGGGVDAAAPAPPPFQNHTPPPRPTPPPPPPPHSHRPHHPHHRRPQRLTHAHTHAKRKLTPLTSVMHE